MSWDRITTGLNRSDAEALLGRLVDHCRAHPDEAAAHHALGEVLLTLQQPLDAKTCWQRCLALDPAHQAARLQLAELLIRIGEPNTALKVLEQSPHPSTPESNTLRGLASSQSSTTHEAAAGSLDKALKGDPSATERLFLQGWQIAAGLVLNGHHHEATPWLEALNNSQKHPRLVRILRLLIHQPRPGDLELVPTAKAQTTEQRVWARLGPALLRTSHPSDSHAALSDTEQLLLHPDPQVLQLAHRQRSELLRQMIQSRGLHRRPGISKQPQRQPPRRWLLLASNALPQCFQFRVVQKQQQLDVLGWESRIVQELYLSSTDKEPLLAWADALVICRLQASEELLDWLQAARAFHVPCFYDIDDLLFDPQHSPPPLTNYAGRLPPELHRRFVIDQLLITEVMRCCDAVIVSTATLKERWIAVNHHQATPQPVLVLPNLAPPELWTHSAGQRDQDQGAPLRLVIASGNSTHLRCWHEELAPALTQLMRRHPTLEVSLLGELRSPLILLEHHARIQHQSSMSYVDYIQAIANNAVGLMVLEPGVFTDAKSANRWMEFSLCGLASVMSPTRTLKDVLIDNKHVLFARGTRQWDKQIERLIHDPDLRQRLAAQARTHARRLFDPRSAATVWTAVASVACQVRPTCS
ncbi:putative alpha-glycosyltransferase/ family 4 [Synechococcus sp. A18-40]|nr:putative alpha-glycosyltransferase/ family 4 [Synechococcus sp. A18-40]